MAESRNEVSELSEIQKDLQESLVRAIDRLNKAEKEVARLSDGAAASQSEKERQDDLRVRLQKQVKSVECIANVLHSMRFIKIALTHCNLALHCFDSVS